jgi:hypothetical protein
MRLCHETEALDTRCLDGTKLAGLFWKLMRMETSSAFCVILDFAEKCNRALRAITNTTPSDDKSVRDKQENIFEFT